MKSIRAINIKFTEADKNAAPWTDERLGKGVCVPLAGDWSADACAKFVKENHPDAISYELNYNYEQNTTCDNE